jgi:hypothetical protein
MFEINVDSDYTRKRSKFGKSTSGGAKSIAFRRVVIGENVDLSKTERNSEHSPSRWQIRRLPTRRDGSPDNHASPTDQGRVSVVEPIC